MRKRFRAAQVLVLGLAAVAVLLVWALAPHRLGTGAYAIVLGVLVVEVVLWFVGQSGPGEGDT